MEGKIMTYQSVSKVVRAGPSSDYGGSSGSGAVFVWLKDIEQDPPRHDWWFEVKLPWANQALATALAAITAGKQVFVVVGEKNNPCESSESGDPYCYRIYLEYIDLRDG
jgi:hypothetical protein